MEFVQFRIDGSKFLAADEVANILSVSKPTAYRLIKQMNDELKNKGMIVVPGKISKRYFEEKCYM